MVTFVRSVRLELVDIPLAADHLKALQSAIPADLTVQFEKSPAATARLLSSWTYVNQAPFNESPNVAQFLRGDQGNWGLIAERDFFERDIEETVYDELLDYATSKSTSGRSLAILGPAGYGTSTLSATLAVKLAHDRAGRVFMHKPGTPFLEGDVLYAASLFPDERHFFFVDDAARFSSEVLNCLYRLREARRPALFLLAARLNEWRLGRGKLNASEFVIEPLSDPESSRLIAFLEKHGPLNRLEHLTPQMRFATVKKKHEKQLLIVMREATEDNSFDAIIEGEYVNIGNDIAKQVYLTVCCFYQHEAFIRDALLADLIGHSVPNMYTLTRDATEGVVLYERIDLVRGTDVARARHRTIAAIVWERCGDIIQKEQLIQKALSALNLNLKTDADSFEQFIRSDHLVDGIRTLDGKTRFFETAIRKDPESAYVRQHYARMLTRSERPELAPSQIDKALGLNSKIRILYHTNGVVQSQLALQTDSIEMARSRLAQTEQAFRQGINLYSRDEYSYYSLAKLYLDWAKKVPSETDEYLSKCESTVSEGLRAVTTKERIWIISADVQEWIGNESAKLDDLQRAIKEQPSGIFARYLLARAYREAGSPAKGVAALEPVLLDNPNEFRLCIEYARCLDDLGETYDKIIAVLALGTLYGLSDSRFISIYGGVLFMNEQFSDSDKVFSETLKHDFSPSDAYIIRYKPKAKDNPAEFTILKGTVVLVKAGYAFIEVPGFPKFLCPSSKQHGLTLFKGMKVSFEPGFSAKRAVADRPFETYAGPKHRRPL